MNDTGLELLVTSYLEQQFVGIPRHLKGFSVATDGRGGFCTLGLFLHAVGCPHLVMPNEQYMASNEAVEAHQVCQQRVSERFGINRNEWLELRAENDRYDWLSIAAIHHEGSYAQPEDEQEEE
jgi:hypothetical protein